MNERNHQMIAYLATLGALVVVFVSALVASGAGVSVTESFGLGTITGGLIGVLRIPAQRSVTVDNPPENPANVQEQPK
jgi:hypothetical protein